jgi:hypothetical protein
MVRDFWIEVKSRVVKWEKRFRKYAENGTMENIETLTGIDAKRLSGRKKTTLARKAFERQITFVKYMAVCYMTGKMDGKGLKDLDRMLELLNMNVSLKKDKKAPCTVVFFMDDGLYVFLAADALDEIDFADVYAGTGFIGFCVHESGRDHWTPSPAKRVEKKIKHDLTYDYKKVILFMQRVPGGNEFLQFRCAISDEDLGMDKIVKIAKVRELFGVEVLGWAEESS